MGFFFFTQAGLQSELLLPEPPESGKTKVTGDHVINGSSHRETVFVLILIKCNAFQAKYNDSLP